ncbi:Methyltransferase domain-containing protein [Tangfeifania diversioriginum]|uniref:Methyltransferase domain-containing protein n=1 Tax=Tangfeifania diversioriginum TaxID=1168035 RepID=A0A1M6BFZ6_9BACT|nr:methyltransferase domain-containing protein [Tangfeifania diversioriginum]SHI47641.1 Methyltransferase domain-containing protein [Tangfeifania diversioriginum]
MKNKNFPKILKCIYCENNYLKFNEERNSLFCTNCNHVFVVTDNVPVLLPEKELTGQSKSEIHEKLGTDFKYIDHYQKDAYTSDYFAERDSGTEHSERRVREYIASHISGKKGRILDVGCGKAWVAELFCPLGFEVISMDISLRNTSKALKKHPFENHHAVVADVFSLPFLNNTFDYIIASEIIEHVQNPATFIEKLFSVLKPGGNLIITTPYKEKLQYSLCIHCNNPTPLHAHLHSFDEKVLTSLYINNDLEQCNYQTFSNKILIHLRLHKILKYMNFKVWKAVDMLMNRIYYVPVRILVKWKKKL